MSDNTLKIRIQIQQPQQQAIEQTYPDLPEPEIVYEYSLDWKKIGAAILLLLFMLALIGYFMLGTDKVQSPSNGEVVAATDPATMQENKIPLEKTAPKSEVKDQSVKTKSSQSLAEQNNAADIIQPKKIQSEKIMNPTGQVAAPIVKSKPEPIIHKPVAIPRNKPESTKSTKSISPSEPQNTSDHPQVLRAQLSHDVKAREPVDAIDSVQLRQGESQPIYFYLHLKNLQGKRVGILWYRNNKLDSQLFLDIHLDNWRTQASKQLDHQRLGAWRVELVDESGSRLATRSFTVTER